MDFSGARGGRDGCMDGLDRNAGMDRLGSDGGRVKVGRGC